MAAASQTGSTLTPAALVRDMVVSGLLAVVLLGPLVGLRTEQNLNNELVLATREENDKLAARLTALEEKLGNA